jgi:retron-type reverse transcriptase
VAKVSGGGKLKGMAVCIHTYQDIISLENLLLAWREFIQGKKNKKDVQLFQRNLMQNVIDLHDNLRNKKYKHSPYEAFKIEDPKPRDIHKASVRDRLLHHAIYRKLYPYFDKQFIHDSYSCRINKGTHKALTQFKNYSNKVSQNHTKTVWILKCDVRKFFASIDQEILLTMLSKYIQDVDILNLLKTIIQSFQSIEKGQGLPLGNLTSQLLVNIYMNEFDQHMKHVLKTKYYIRYADDFVIMSDDKKYLELVLTDVKRFLVEKLKLQLHPYKVFIKTLYSGMDFLGWVHFPKHRVLRTVTNRRMFKKLSDEPREETIQSYIGLLSHGDTYGLTQRVIDTSSRSKLV